MPFLELFKNRILFSHIAVGGDTNRGVEPWPVSPATFGIERNTENYF